jgi:isochorismate synthase EntC
MSQHSLGLPLCFPPAAAHPFLCCATEVQKSVLKQAAVQHLYGRLAGVLRRGVGDAAVLEALHPTPAVCGRPREAAMR